MFVTFTVVHSIVETRNQINTLSLLILRVEYSILLIYSSKDNRVIDGASFVIYLILLT